MCVCVQCHTMIHTRTHIFYVNVQNFYYLCNLNKCISKLTTRAKVRRAAAVFIMSSFVKSGIWVKTKLCKCSFHMNWPVLVHFPHVIFYSAPDKECRIPWNDKGFFLIFFTLAFWTVSLIFIYIWLLTKEHTVWHPFKLTEEMFLTHRKIKVECLNFLGCYECQTLPDDRIEFYLFMPLSVTLTAL